MPKKNRAGDLTTVGLVQMSCVPEPEKNIEGDVIQEQRVVLSFGGSRNKDAPSLASHPLVRDPLGELARWRAAGADEVLVTARRTDDVDALLESAGRW